MRAPLAAIALASAFAARPAVAEVRSAFAFLLSDQSGALNLSWPALTWDGSNRELYVVDGHNGVVQVFNDAGMAVFSFGDDTAFGTPVALASAEDQSGDLFVLVYDAAGKWAVVRCNFRGDPVGRLELKGVPDRFTDGFGPGTLIGRGGKLYLADKSAMKVLVLRPDGTVDRALHLGSLLQIPAKKRNGLDLRGFNVDREGNILFTISALFQAFVLAPDGKLRAFGSRGSAPGRFNIVAGIAADDRGNYWLTDALRAVVMVFDQDFRFRGEFGYRGYDDENLISPNDLAVTEGRVFVNQSTGGVKAFDVVLE